MYDFKIIQDDKELNISFGGNGDLYFYVNKPNFEEQKQIVNFEITKENYELYDLFEKLYNTIINCDIYKINELDLELRDAEEIEEKQLMYDEWNRELRKYPPYNLIHDGIISWRHDDQIFEEANILNIHKEKDKYRLEFILNSKEMSQYIDIRFRNSGSRYQPFNRTFMDLYKALQLYGITDKKEDLNQKNIYKK